MFQRILHDFIELTKYFQLQIDTNSRPFPSSFEPHYESETTCMVFIMKLSFHSYANTTNLHNYGKLCTQPRFHNEVHSNSEIAYYKKTSAIKLFPTFIAFLNIPPEHIAVFSSSYVTHYCVTTLLPTFSKDREITLFDPALTSLLRKSMSFTHIIEHHPVYQWFSSCEDWHTKRKQGAGMAQW